MSTNNEILGVRSSRREDLEIYDQLPKWARRRLQNAVRCWSAHYVRMLLLEGMKARELDALMRKHDR